MEGLVMAPNNTDFASRLKAARLMRHVTQVELSRKSGIPAPVISHFEHGRREPSLGNFRRLADALSVSADFLLYRAEKADMSGPSSALFWKKMCSLTEEERDFLLDVANGCIRRRKSK